MKHDLYGMRGKLHEGDLFLANGHVMNSPGGDAPLTAPRSKDAYKIVTLGNYLGSFISSVQDVREGKEPSCGKER